MSATRHPTPSELARMAAAVPSVNAAGSRAVLLPAPPDLVALRGDPRDPDRIPVVAFLALVGPSGGNFWALAGGFVDRGALAPIADLLWVGPGPDAARARWDLQTKAEGLGEGRIVPPEGGRK